MLPWSVMPSAGWPSAAAARTSVLDPGRAVEHRELGVGVQVGERPSHRCCQCHPPPGVRKVLHTLWTSYRGVIPNIAQRVGGGAAPPPGGARTHPRRAPTCHDRCRARAIRCFGFTDLSGFTAC